VNAPRTIPRDTLESALQALGVDIPMADILSVQLLPRRVIVLTWPDFELHTWRVVDECPSCHTTAGHPHTEYCLSPKAGIRAQRVGPAFARTCRVCGCTDEAACPGGCAWVPGEPDLCTACLPNHGHAASRALTDLLAPEPEPWVDNGCRCPNPDLRHLEGCPAIDPPLSSLPD
jgi:hypothetical protein